MACGRQPVKPILVLPMYTRLPATARPEGPRQEVRPWQGSKWLGRQAVRMRSTWEEKENKRPEPLRKSGKTSK